MENSVLEKNQRDPVYRDVKNVIWSDESSLTIFVTSGRVHANREDDNKRKVQV